MSNLINVVKRDQVDITSRLQHYVTILKVNKKDDDIVSYLRTQKDEGLDVISA